jgi:formylglycine-generating enzyme required for sulfatase activity/predicted Ser/Thr protein kinase
MSNTEVAIAPKPGSMLQEYRIERVLGHGGFGITYLAYDTHLHKTVAIKEYLPADLAVRASDHSVTARASDAQESFAWGLGNFVKEARLLARFSHPNLIRVHRYFEAHGTAYFVMEYAEGTTLAAELRQSSTLTESRIRNVLLPIMSGLEQVHREGVLHRDIKPDNIILRSDGTPVLIDFGAARQTLGSMTRSVLSVVTAGYAPLEQYATSGDQGPWTDLYALGAVAYRALSGRKPIDAVSRVREDPLVPAHLAGAGRYAPQFLAAVDWALAVSAEDRPRSVTEWRQALEGELHPPSAGVTAAPAPSSQGARSDPTQVLPKARIPEVPVEPTIALPRTQTPEVDRADNLATAQASGRRSLAAVVAAIVVLTMLLMWLFVSKPRSAPVPERTTQAEPAAPQTPLQDEPAATGLAEPPMAQEPAPVPETLPQSGTPPAAAPAKKPAVRRPAETASRTPTPVARMAALSTFRDCASCPEMVVLPAGSFQMGSPAGIGAHWENPQHAVTLKRPFAMARHETTTSEWSACVNAGRCRMPAAGPASGDTSRVPIVNVTRLEAQDYTQWLSESTGRRYRLPSEAEWEYAVRAGTTTSRYWGDDRRGQCEYANAADVSATRRDSRLQGIDCDDGFPALAPVGSFKPNAFALFDMAGNVWEWTLDCWQDHYRSATGAGRPVEMPDCSRYVIRGGSWRTRPESLRSANRGVSAPDHRSEDLGLRVVAE